VKKRSLVDDLNARSENPGAGHRGVELAKSKAGVLKAGVLDAGADLPTRAVAGMWLLEELKKKVMARNTVLGNIHRDAASSDAPRFLRMYQTDVDMILWVMTCCGLVEVDEQVQRIAAVPSDMRDTFSRVLGRR